MESLILLSLELWKGSGQFSEADGWDVYDFAESVSIIWDDQT